MKEAAGRKAQVTLASVDRCGQQAYRWGMGTHKAHELLRELRHEQGKSLRQVAKDLGVNPSYLSRLERGEKPASPRLCEKVADYYVIPQETMSLALGTIPSDIVEILKAHPEAVALLRERYGLGS